VITVASSGTSGAGLGTEGAGVTVALALLPVDITVLFVGAGFEAAVLAGDVLGTTADAGAAEAGAVLCVALRPGETAVGGTPRFCACAANELTKNAIKKKTFKDRLIFETPS